MRLGIDVQTLETAERSRGIGRYTAGLIQGLLEAAPGWTLELFGFAPACPVNFDLRNATAALRYHAYPPGLSRAELLAAGGAAPLAWAFPELELDCFLATSPLMHDVVQPGDAPCPLGCILYDLAPLALRGALPDILPPPLWPVYQQRLENLRRFDFACAISDFTRRDAIARLNWPPHAIRNVSTGIHERFFQAVEPAHHAEILARHGLRPPFILSVSGFNARKNWEGLLEAFSLLPRRRRGRRQLAIVCELNPAQREVLSERARQLGVAAQLRLTGFVPDEELPALYQAAECFVFPSRYEGFGIPLAEALAGGCPAAAADNSSLPEAAGESGILFDAANPAAAAAAIERACAIGATLDRAALRRSAERFRWPRVAQNLIAALEDFRYAAQTASITAGGGCATFLPSDELRLPGPERATPLPTNELRLRGPGRATLLPADELLLRGPERATLLPADELCLRGPGRATPLPTNELHLRWLRRSPPPGGCSWRDDALRRIAAALDLRLVRGGARGDRAVYPLTACADLERVEREIDRYGGWVWLIQAPHEVRWEGEAPAEPKVDEASLPRQEGAGMFLLRCGAVRRIAQLADGVIGTPASIAALNSEPRKSIPLNWLNLIMLPQPQTPNPETRNPKPETRNPQSAIRNPLTLLFLDAYAPSAQAEQLLSLLGEQLAATNLIHDGPAPLALRVLFAGEMKEPRILRWLETLAGQLRLEDQIRFYPLTALDELRGLADWADLQALASGREELLAAAAVAGGCPLAAPENLFPPDLPDGAAFKLLPGKSFCGQLQLLLAQLLQNRELAHQARRNAADFLRNRPAFSLPAFVAQLQAEK